MSGSSFFKKMILSALLFARAVLRFRVFFEYYGAKFQIAYLARARPIAVTCVKNLFQRFIKPVIKSNILSK